MNNAWKIRLLGGLLHGREIWLSEGRLSVGERGCDLCIPLNIKGNVVLLVKDDRLFVDAGKAPVRVNGRRHAQDTPLPAKGMLQVGGISMLFGDREDDLAVFRPPVRRAAAFGVGTMLLVLFIMLFSLLLIVEPRKPEVNVPARVDMLLRQMALSQVTARWEPDRALVLSGYCRNEKTLQALRGQLRAWGVLYRDNIVCVEQLERNVEDVLSQAGYPQATVVYKGGGEVGISADITMGKRWSEVQSLLAEVPGLTRWQLENPYEIQGQSLIAALIQQGLADAVSMTSVGHSFVMSGVLDAEQKQKLARVMSDLRQRYPDVALSYQDVPASSEFSQRLPSPVVGIIHGRRGNYLVLENGERLTIGSRLPDGSEVVALNDKAVAFQQGRALFNYPFNF